MKHSPEILVKVGEDPGLTIAQFFLDHPKHRQVLMTREAIDTTFKDEKPAMYYEPSGYPDDLWWVPGSEFIRVFMSERSEP